MSKVTIGIGLQYGDEGKGKVFDKIILAKIWARFNGGANAGHNLFYNGIHIVTHSIPSGIFHEDAFLYIGSGCVINPNKILDEIKDIESKGIDLSHRLLISPYASLVQPSHIITDAQTGKSVGTTKNGIGPAYAGQALRKVKETFKNIRLGDFLQSPELFSESILQNILIAANYKAGTKIGHMKLAQEFLESSQVLEKYLCPNTSFINNHVEAGNDVFMEGANSIMLDAVTGDVPYVTGSRTIAGAAYTGGDLAPRHRAKVIGVAKAIMSRVGNGPFISELGGTDSERYCAEVDEHDNNLHSREIEFAKYDADALLKSSDAFEVGIGLRIKTRNYGASTGRPRRTGLLDLVELRDACKTNSVDEVYINQMDCMRFLSSGRGFPVVTAYTLDGRTIHSMPATIEEKRRCRPVLDYLPAVHDDISKARQQSDLPDAVIESLR